MWQLFWPTLYILCSVKMYFQLLKSDMTQLKQGVQNIYKYISYYIDHTGRGSGHGLG